MKGGEIAALGGRILSPHISGHNLNSKYFSIGRQSITVADDSIELSPASPRRQHSFFRFYVEPKVSATEAATTETPRHCREAHIQSPHTSQHNIFAMSLVTLAHVCSHLQNAGKARLGLTSVPLSNMILGLTLSLQQSGFLQTVTRGGPTPPPVDSLATYVPEPVTQSNIASRRLWLGLKYWNNEPVLSKMNVVSKPTKRIYMDSEGIAALARGKDAGFVKGLRRPGECIFVCCCAESCKKAAEE